jgi:hypothetical protein
MGSTAARKSIIEPSGEKHMDRSHRLGAFVKFSAKPVLALAACLAVGSMAHFSRAADDNAGGKQISFSKDIQPLLKESCVKCHKAPEARNGPGGQGGGPGGGGGRRGPQGPAGGLRLDDPALMMKGGKHAPDIVAGKAGDSLLYQVLKGQVTKGNDKINQMPKGRPNQPPKPLADDKIALIKAWIDQGAKTDN